ncbi:fimbria/pilus outer membrane usher protein [Escherichia coli]
MQHFDQLNSRVTFAGYRFSEENFMTMSEYLDASDSGMVRTGTTRCTPPLITSIFRHAGVSVYLNYTRHTYWDREDTNHNIMLSHYFNTAVFVMSASRLLVGCYEYDNQADKGM